MPTATAAQRRALARDQHNAAVATCPGHQVLSILTAKWTTLVLEALAQSPLRRGELARRVPGATQKVLTETLRRLERDGLITRTITAAVPARVDYRLTTLGSELADLQAGILAWGQAHITQIRDARASYDER